MYILRLDIFYLPLRGTGPLYSNSLAYPSLSDMLLLQCPQYGRTPLGLAEMNSREEAAEVLRMLQRPGGLLRLDLRARRKGLWHGSGLASLPKP